MKESTQTVAAKLDDADLLAAIARSRDASAFAAFSKRHEGAVYSAAVHITGNAALAEEAVQEAMLRVWTSAASYRGDGPVSAWLMRIVTRESSRIVQTAKRSSGRLRAIDANTCLNSQTSPESAAESSELIQAVKNEYLQLSELEQQLLGLHFVQGMSQRQIGRALAIPQQTISYHLNEALKLLRLRLSAVGRRVHLCS